MIGNSLGLSGMHEGEESSLTTLWLPSAQQQRKLLVTGVLATVLTMAEMYNGSVTRVLRYIKRQAVRQCQPALPRQALTADPARLNNNQ